MGVILVCRIGVCIMKITGIVVNTRVNRGTNMGVPCVSRADNICRNNNYNAVTFSGKDHFVKSLNSLEDVISVFDKQAAEVPVGLNLKVSPRTGKILAFSKKLENGNVLNVIKTGSDGTHKSILYVLFKETKNEKPVSTIGVDFESAELLKLRAGKPRVSGKKLERLDYNDSEYAISEAKLDSYIKQISKHDDYQAESTTVEVLKAKKSKPHRILVDDLVSEREEMPDDAAFSKMIARDIQMGEEERENAQERFYEDASADFDRFMKAETEALSNRY